MNRAQRRRAAAAARAYDRRLERDRSNKQVGGPTGDLVFKRIEQIMATDGDNCSLCRAPFQHNHRSLGGVTSDGSIVLVGECCKSKLGIVVTSGLYTNRPYAELRNKQRNDSNTVKPNLSSEQIEEAITAYQQHFAATDKIVDETARRAGIPVEKMILHREDDVAWKADDRAWFENNPTRSHRLRRLFPGESTGMSDEAIPPGHELQILVRQVEPGLRARHGFYRNLAADIPDVEAVLHALFDVVVNKRAGPISGQDLEELARKYERHGALS